MKWKRENININKKKQKIENDMDLGEMKRVKMKRIEEMKYGWVQEINRVKKCREIKKKREIKKGKIRNYKKQCD